MAHRFTTLMCLAIALGGCNRPKSPEPISHDLLSLESDVPVPPFARHVAIKEVDAQSHSYRVEFSIPKNSSSAFFYEQACAIAGWHCEWLSGHLEPWIGIFYKPGRVCVVEQRKEQVVLYAGSRASSDRSHHQRRR